MNSNWKIVPARIVEARESRGLSLAELTKILGVSRQAISKYEKGINNPSSETLHILAHELDFPIDYFYKPISGDIADSGSIFFRSNSNIPKKKKKACEFQVKWIDEIKAYLDQYVEFFPPNIPMDFDGIDHYETFNEDDIEEYALYLRNEWGIHDDPVSDLIGLLENNGFIIAQFRDSKICDFKGIDAFSCWKNKTPYILYNAKQKSAVRTIFSILHEVAHLIFHSEILKEESVKKEIIDFADSQADRFAAAFLLPMTSFSRDVRGTSIDKLIPVKRKWSAALSTIIRRCRTLNILSEHQIAYLQRQMTDNKYWRKEPLDDQIKLKGPEVIKDSITLLIDSKLISRDKFIIDNSFSLNDVTALCSLPNTFVRDFQDFRSKPVLRLLETE